MYNSEDIRNIFLTMGPETLEIMQAHFSEFNFYANICPVCLKHDRETRLKICSGCKMISYCGKEHQTQNWSKHKEICKIISNQLKMSKTSNIFDAVSPLKSNTSDNGIITLKEKKNYVLQFVIDKFKHDLNPFEIQMILFPKHCETCGITDPIALTSCPNCPHANFCNEHKNDSEHIKVCTMYTNCCLMDAYQILIKLNKTLREDFAVNIFNGNVENFPKSMTEFMDLHCTFKIFDLKTLFFQNLFYSDYLTNSMTLCYILKKLNLPIENSEIHIHFIVENLEDISKHHYWELIIHWLSHIINLKIVFFISGIKIANFPLEICEICKQNEKSIVLEFCELNYKDYLKTDQFIKPAIVVGLNFDKSFLKNIGHLFFNLKKINCPFIITALCLMDGCTNLEMLRELFKINGLFLERNPFSSSRYIRQINELNGVAVSNKYIIYLKEVNQEKVKDISVPINEGFSIQNVDYDKLIEENLNLKKKAEILLEKKKMLERVIQEFKIDCQQEMKKLWTNFQRIENKIKEINIHCNE
ncbi:uncharacterized protein LOC127279435 isoform X1 [Leptopilina boulardi]|uniref:uncharacterized protein LOC127279435 isoform X1 n=1 Tax=Leptopilina boulardi TaxID=63433 RepID=UPI0021F65D7F|nr:uncharacterized protein LOC127279435 isoform X1 [Leptopilina boulardi]